MAELKIALGAVADVCTSEEMKSAVTGLQGHIDRKMFGNDAVKPIRRPLGVAQTYTLASGASDVLVIGRPPLGAIWSLASITILGSDDHTAVTGLTAAMYIGDSTAPLLTQCEIPGQAIPYFDSFGYPDYWVHDQQQLFLNLEASAPITAQQVTAHAWVMEFRDQAAEQQIL